MCNDKRRITVYLPEQTIIKLDEMVAKLGFTRSTLIQMAITYTTNQKTVEITTE